MKGMELRASHTPPVGVGGKADPGNMDFFFLSQNVRRDPGIVTFWKAGPLAWLGEVINVDINMHACK